METARVKINGFDFDSDDMIEALDTRPTFFELFGPLIIEYLFAWDIVFAGAWAVKWFAVGSGAAWLMKWFAYFSPALFRMATTGQL